MACSAAQPSGCQTSIKYQFFRISDDAADLMERWQRDHKNQPLTASERDLLATMVRTSKDWACLAQPTLVALEGQDATIRFGGEVGGASYGCNVCVRTSVGADNLVHLEQSTTIHCKCDTVEVACSPPQPAVTDSTNVTHTNLASGATLMTVVRMPGENSHPGHFLVLATPEVVTPAPVVRPAALSADSITFTGNGVIRLMGGACVTEAPVAFGCPVPPPCAEEQDAPKQGANAYLDKMMSKYWDACAAGDYEKARKLARRCIDIDPMCFSRDQ